VAQERIVVIGDLIAPDEAVVTEIRKRRPIWDTLRSVIETINPYYRRITLFEGTQEELKLKGYEIGIRIKLRW
jgi:hypothetical protein